MKMFKDISGHLPLKIDVIHCCVLCLPFICVFENDPVK